MYPGAGTQDDPVGLGDGVDDDGGNLGSLGGDTHMLNGARRDGDLALAGNDVAASAVIHVGFNIDGGGRHGQDTTLRAKQAPDPVESFNRVVEELPESRDDQITERVSIEGTGRVQAQLHDVAPGESPFRILHRGRPGPCAGARGRIAISWRRRPELPPRRRR